MELVVAFGWLLAMIGLFSWLLWWDRVEQRDHEHRSPTDLDVLTASRTKR